MPVCPFCRENFTNDSVRIIRMDFNSSSGWNTPRRMPVPHVDSSQTDFAALWARKMERSGTRPDVRKLEDKVAKVAAKKCSVEEVSALYQELDGYVNQDEIKAPSLYLSVVLLRCILLNHQAHSEASRNMKAVEANLKAKVDDLQLNNEKIEFELRKYRQLYTNKAQEYQTVCVELNRLKGSLGISSDARQSATSPPPPPTSPTPYTSSSSATQSPLSRLNSMHQRSASMSSRPTTPAMSSPTRPYTPAPPLPRMQTPGPPLTRTQTPMARPYTPGLTSLRSMTQTPSPMRHTTPAPPPIPTKPRRLSTPSPPKMMRSSSEEKAELHQIWMPPESPMRPPSRSATRTPYTTASSRFSPSVAR
ncbi:hypothetical protein C0991_009932 [Blastosporella zonata]|nr:hypothetical protein C0991_009932 [Blastosporella zonata]